MDRLIAKQRQQPPLESQGQFDGQMGSIEIDQIYMPIAEKPAVKDPLKLKKPEENYTEKLLASLESKAQLENLHKVDSEPALVRNAPKAPTPSVIAKNIEPLTAAKSRQWFEEIRQSFEFKETTDAKASRLLPDKKTRIIALTNLKSIEIKAGEESNENKKENKKENINSERDAQCLKIRPKGGLFAYPKVSRNDLGCNVLLEIQNAFIKRITRKQMPTPEKTAANAAGDLTLELLRSFAATGVSSTQASTTLTAKKHPHLKEGSHEWGMWLTQLLYVQCRHLRQPLPAHIFDAKKASTNSLPYKKAIVQGLHEIFSRNSQKIATPPHLIQSKPDEFVRAIAQLLSRL